MQAGGDFARLSHSLWIEATVRLLATVVFVALGLGATGAALGLFASFVAAHAVASGVLRPISARRMRSSGRPAASPGSVRAGTSAMVVLLAGQVVIVNGDVLVIAARLPTEAGIYAAVALIGRLVFMVSWTVVTVVFPSVADPDAIDRTRLVTRAVAITAGLGAAMTAGAWLAGDTVLALMLGEAYRAGGDLLWPYALATALFSIVNLLATVDVARQRIGGPLLVLVASAVHTAALLLVAPLGAASAVWARLGLMAVLLTVAGIHWIGAERAGWRSSPVALTMDARP